MLGKIRRFSNGRGSKFLLGGIILIFISFGLSGLKAPKDTIVSIDGEDIISIYDFQKERNHLSLVAQGSIPDSELTRLALSNLISENLIALELKRLGIIISDDVVIDHIKQDKMFQNKSGNFDSDLFKRALVANNITESSYVSKLKNSIGSNILLNQLNISKVPDQIIIQFDKYKRQKRQAELFLVGLTSDIKVSDAEVQSYYELNKSMFYQPELRKLEYIIMNPSSFKGAKKIDETQVDQEIKELNISSDEEKKKVRANIIENKLEQQMYESMKNIEDAAASGESLKEISTKLNLKYIVVPFIDARGFSSDGSISKDIPDSSKFLEEGFSLEEGVISEIIKSDNKDEYYMIGVIQAQPKKLKDLDQVKQAIVREVRNQKIAELNRKLAIDIREDFINNKKLNDKYKDKLDVKRIEISRPVMHKDTDNLIMNYAIFNLESLGDYTEVIRMSNGDFAFAKLLSIDNPGSPSSSEINAAKNESTRIINESLQQSLSETFNDRYKIEVFQENIPR